MSSRVNFDLMNMPPDLWAIHERSNQTTAKSAAMQSARSHYNGSITTCPERKLRGEGIITLEGLIGRFFPLGPFACYPDPYQGRPCPLIQVSVPNASALAGMLASTVQ